MQIFHTPIQLSKMSIYIFFYLKADDVGAIK